MIIKGNFSRSIWMAITHLAFREVPKCLTYRAYRAHRGALGHLQTCGQIEATSGAAAVGAGEWAGPKGPH